MLSAPAAPANPHSAGVLRKSWISATSKWICFFGNRIGLYSFTRTLFQAIKRALKRSLTQEELWEGTGNRESLRRSFFSKESIIWWMITTYSGVRLKYEACMKDPKYAHIHFIRLRSPRETENFLEAKVQS